MENDPAHPPAEKPVGDGGRPHDRPEHPEHPDRLERLERRLSPLLNSTDALLPAWRRATRGERRWPASLAVIALIVLQVMLPEPLTVGPRWLLPAVQAVMLIVLTVANPSRVERDSPALRRPSA